MALARLRLTLEVTGNDGATAQYVDRTVNWVPAVPGGKREEVSLTGAAFTALSPPTGARAVLILPDEEAVSLSLKGVTGDTGTTMAPASNPINGPSLLFLGSSPSIGIANGGSTTTAVVIWL